jgi:hypothetical protein
MSALGHKQTFRNAIATSALPPKADIETQSRDVRFVPKADIPLSSGDVRFAPNRLFEAASVGNLGFDRQNDLE